MFINVLSTLIYTFIYINIFIYIYTYIYTPMCILIVFMYIHMGDMYINKLSALNLNIYIHLCIYIP